METARLTLGLAVFVLVLGAASAQDSSKLAHLKGVKGIAVDVIIDGVGIDRPGDVESQIKTDAELRSRMAGLLVGSAPTAASQSFNLLEIDVFTNEVPGSGLVSYRAEVSLLQPARSLLNDTMMLGKAWTQAKSGAFGKQNIRDLRSTITDIIDKLLNDLLAANPRN
jgi:hypothetical protein